ncbi:MAG: lytic transglycosylase domain-containing protein [Endomicrobia bacterium]|nr:lytic transglycosylase domain-containing protein [Endomicrobiia bacterium]
MKKQINKLRLSILIAALFAVTGGFIYTLKYIGIFDGMPYKEEVENASALLYGMDPLLIEAVMKRESNLNPNAVSSKGAVGLMQIMPATAREIAYVLEIQDYSDDMLKDPQINILFGAYYLTRLLAYYNSNLILTLAAYNAGMGNVDKWIEKDPKVAKKISGIPFRETQRHVRSIIITYNFYKGAEQLKRLLRIKRN